VPAIHAQTVRLLLAIAGETLPSVPEVNELFDRIEAALL
jgi:hypothetical protein